MFSFKKIVRIFLSLSLSLSAGLLPEAGGGVSADGPERVSVYIDGLPGPARTPSILCYAQTYVSFRDYSVALGAGGVYPSQSGAGLTASAPGLTLEARAGDCYIVANGRYLYAPLGCIDAAGDILVPLRVLASAFGASVAWNATRRSAYVGTAGARPIESGDSFYNSEDVLWMSRIISAEARGEPMKGKIAVGGVVMNRRASPKYPNTVYGVIFDRRSGIQFTPAYSGAIYNTPSADCVIAAKIALDGGNPVGDSLFFSSESYCWAAKNRPYNGSIGNHNFYA
jgi:N-acetylmuramoyl-L-alanine amidase